MKTTQYFKYARKRSDRSCIKDEWIETAMKNPIKEEVQSDNRIKRWVKIEEVGKYLRIILLEDGETVYNASSLSILH